MPVKSIEQPAYLIVDNSVLSMITEWYCTEKWCCIENRGLTPIQILDRAQQWILTQLALLRSYSSDNLLHTTTHVSAEYRPKNGILGSRGLLDQQINAMADQIRRNFSLLGADINSIRALRTLPGANKRLIHPQNGLSDPDLSLVHLALDLTRFGQPVVLLSNDQDLLEFVTWIKTQKCLSVGVTNPRLIEGETGLGYLELIHRSCQISSEQMGQMINFIITDTVSRMQQKTDGTQLNPQKAMKIYQKVAAINGLFVQAVEIKAQNRRVAA